MYEKYFLWPFLYDDQLKSRSVTIGKRTNKLTFFSHRSSVTWRRGRNDRPMNHHERKSIVGGLCCESTCLQSICCVGKVAEKLLIICDMLMINCLKCNALVVWLEGTLFDACGRRHRCSHSRCLVIFDRFVYPFGFFPSKTSLYQWWWWWQNIWIEAHLERFALLFFCKYMNAENSAKKTHTRTDRRIENVGMSFEIRAN